MAKRKKLLTSPRQVWDEKRDAFNAAKDEMSIARVAWELAVADTVKAEAALAKAGLALHRAGYSEANGWLVWWWNNGATSPRGDRACVDYAKDIPFDAQPKDPKEVLR